MIIKKIPVFKEWGVPTLNKWNETYLVFLSSLGIMSLTALWHEEQGRKQQVYFTLMAYGALLTKALRQTTDFNGMCI